MTPPTPTPQQPAGPWKDGAAAVAYLGRIQKLLDAKGLDGTEKKLKPLMRKAARAFQARDYTAFTTACDALVDAIEAFAGGVRGLSPTGDQQKKPRR